MALSKEFCAQHIEHWEARLLVGHPPYRSKWPSRLFHHAPIENAVEILRAMEIRSRNDVAGIARVDAAAQAVIGARGDAHRFGRLYFRPRTPTQFHCEGIQKETELYQGAHSPVLIMLVLKAESVLTSEGVHFSNINMQSPAARYDQTEDFFSEIDFDLVFHDSRFGAQDGQAIIKARCAEVLVPSPFDIREALEFIYCRSPAEREYLIERLGPQGRALQEKVRVSDDLRVFEKRYAFVQDVKLQQNGIVFRFNPRRDLAETSVQIQVFDLNQQPIINWGPGELKAAPDAGGRWIIKKNLPYGSYDVQIHMENQLAYRATQIIGDIPF